MNETELIAEIRSTYEFSPSSPMGMGQNPALLIVDFIEGFTNAESPLGGNWDEQIENTIVLITEARNKKLPMLFTTVEYSAAELDNNLLRLKTPRIGTLVTDSRWSEIDHRLPLSEQDILISKQYGSAFFATSLATQLQVLNIDTLLISGCVTSGCVRASAVDAAQNGFRPIIVRETVGDRSRLAHETNLMDIDQRYGDVITLEHALQYVSAI